MCTTTSVLSAFHKESLSHHQRQRALLHPRFAYCINNDGKVFLYVAAFSNYFHVFLCWVLSGARKALYDVSLYTSRLHCLTTLALWWWSRWWGIWYRVVGFTTCNASLWRQFRNWVIWTAERDEILAQHRRRGNLKMVHSKI